MGTVVQDYLRSSADLRDAAIVTNPPYTLAVQFIQKAISDGCPFNSWLLRTNFLEAACRKAFFELHPPSRIWVASARLPTIHRLGWAGKRSGNNVSYAWFVWDASAPRGPMVGWFDWHDREKESAE